MNVIVAALEKRGENMTHTLYGVFLMNLEVFGNVTKHCLECVLYLLNPKKKTGENREIKWLNLQSLYDFSFQT